MQQNSARRGSIILGVFLAIVLIGGTILQVFSPNTTTTTPTEPTEPVIPTFPPPPSDLNSITFNSVYFHPTGLFTIGQPTGWQVSQPNSNPAIAQVNLINNELLSVIDAYVEQAGFPITADDLDARFTQDALRQSWAQFTTWEELTRRRDGDSLLIDFEVDLQQQTYIARQRIWTDGTWIYVVRVLTPGNANDMLFYVLDNLVNTFTPFKIFEGQPFEWQAYYDSIFNHIIRHPQAWTVTDAVVGRPATISAPDGTALRVEAQPGVSIADEAAARAWVESARRGATLLSAQPYSSGEAQGFSVAYTFTDIDGEAQSGFAVLLNGGDGTLHAANLRFPGRDIDLNTFAPFKQDAAAEATPEATAEATSEPTAIPTPQGPSPFIDPFLTLVPPTPIPLSPAILPDQLAQVMGSFHLIAPLTLSVDSLPPATPTPFASPTPADATAEATGDAPAATEAAAPDATAEATGDAPAATAEATGDAPAATEAATPDATAEATPGQ